MVRWLILSVMPLFLVSGCGDLEPDMQDTRTVILNMDFHEKSSSRSSSSVSAAELSQWVLYWLSSVAETLELLREEDFP